MFEIMTPSQELEVDAHILAASNLRNTSIGYKALASVLKHGNLLCIAFCDYEVFVNFTRMLWHLKVDFEFVPFGLQLKENTKQCYRDARMIPKAAPVVTYNYEKKYSRIGKDDPEEGKIEWNEKRFE